MEGLQKRLNDRVALITGASRGIGRAVALALAAEGANVVVNYASSSTAAEAVVTEITEAGGKAIAILLLTYTANQITVTKLDYSLT